VDLEALLEEPVEPPDRVLAKYSFDTSASQVYNLFKTIVGAGSARPYRAKL
jgi:hypothetical protein